MVKVAIAMFVFGWLGATVTCLGTAWFLSRPPKWKVPTPQTERYIPDWLAPFRSMLSKPEAPKDYPVTPIPRTVGSWRKQKAELERQHNSKQKERDQRVAGL
jgi:hypothetical protein